MVETTKRFEQLLAEKKIHGAAPQKMILNGSIATSSDPYTAFADKGFLALHIALTEEELMGDTNEVIARYRNEFKQLVTIPDGRVEVLYSTIRGIKYAAIYCHCYTVEAAKHLYESLKKEYFTE